MSSTIPELFDAAVARSPSKVWLRFEDLSYTYEEAHGHIAAAASRLRDLRVRRETLVAATMRNTPAHLFTWLGLMRLGAVLVPANPRSSAAELAALVA